MATKVHMEALSPTMEEGQLVKWLKAEGDPVNPGEILAEIETDKAIMELVARGGGVLRKVLLPEGGTAPVGTLIGIIAGSEEDIGALLGETVETASVNLQAGRGSEPALRGRAGAGGGFSVGGDGPPATGGLPATGVEAISGGGPAGTHHQAYEVEPFLPGSSRIKASPVARRLASEANLDLRRIQGSGPGGRIVKRDVEEALVVGIGAGGGLSAIGHQAGGAAAVAPTGSVGIATAAPVPSTSPGGKPGVPTRLAWRAGDGTPDFEDIPLSQMRKTIARRLVESMAPVPHFFLRINVDLTRTLEIRSRLNALLEKEGEKLSINDFILKAVAEALARHPEVNAQWNGNSVRRHYRVHLGVAVAVEEGLVTPVIRDAQDKGLRGISREMRDLAARAQEKRLLPEEYTGSTFSVSNLGMFGIHEFTAVINPPEAGILAVGAVEETPVVKDGGVTIRPLLKMTMSCDHRVIDGATGARFLQTVKLLLEEPAATLL